LVDFENFPNSNAELAGSKTTLRDSSATRFSFIADVFLPEILRMK
jgi:hypothetical protein